MSESDGAASATGFFRSLDRHLWGLMCFGIGLIAWRAGLATPNADWQPSLAATQPWRAVTAAFVHVDDPHARMNLAGLAAVALFGVAANARGAQCAAWLLAWPLTQFALVLQPSLLHYAGMSGVLHAATAIVAVQLVRDVHLARRLVGSAVLLGLAVKLALEWRASGAPFVPPGFDFAVVPLAHVAGAVIGAACSAWFSRPRFAHVPRPSS